MSQPPRRRVFGARRMLDLSASVRGLAAKARAAV
jgi:hypothetical protein